MLAASNRRLAHVILLAGPGVPGSEVLISQAAAIANKSGLGDPHANLRKQIIELILRDATREEIDKVLDDFLGASSDNPAAAGDQNEFGLGGGIQSRSDKRGR